MINNILLIRHGNPNYKDCLISQNKAGIPINLNNAGLSTEGIQNCKNVADVISSFKPEVIISSPLTRALQTAIIFSHSGSYPLFIEKDLTEWLTNCSITINGKDEYNRMLEEVTQHNGIYDKTCKYIWESFDELKNRAFNVISKYIKEYKKIVVVSHKMLIFQLTGVSTSFCEYITTNLNDIQNRGIITQ